MGPVNEDERDIPPSEVWEQLRPEQRTRVIHLLAKMFGEYISARPEFMATMNSGHEVNPSQEDQPKKP
jgi:hypothetical protein